MKYENIVEGKFLNRPNRFIANVIINGEEIVCHVKNTGRCIELLTPNATVYLERASNPNRKTQYDLISVVKGDMLINMDSQVPNKVVGEWIDKGKMFDKIAFVRGECTYSNSRFDWYLEADGKKIFIEVKGATLEQDGVVMFPDAPTLRGVKHVYELIKAKEAGYECYVMFVVQLQGADYLTPNTATHPEFTTALIAAKNAGVNILALECMITKDSIEGKQYMEIRFQ